MTSSANVLICQAFNRDFVNIGDNEETCLRSIYFMLIINLIVSIFKLLFCFHFLNHILAKLIFAKQMPAGIRKGYIFG